MKRALRVALSAFVLAACGGAQTQPEHVIVASTGTPTCPPNTIYNGVGCATPLSDPAPDAGAPAHAAGAPSLADEARDPRPLARSQRPVEMLTKELGLLDQLLAAVPQTAADRPALLGRIGDQWFELAYAYGAQGRAAEAGAARRKALDAYDVLLRDHPNAPRGDDAAYFGGYVAELSGDFSGARKRYYVLIQRWPSSKWIGHAYYAFGALFLDEARADPTKAALARQAFQEVIKFPQSDARPWAMLGLGQAFELDGDDAKAKAIFARLRAEFPSHPATAKAP